MRKFFVYFLILGVLTTTALLTLADLPDYITSGYSEDEYFTQLALLSGGTMESNVTSAKKEVIQQIFRNASALFNPRKKAAKGKTMRSDEYKQLEGEYAAALHTLKEMRPTEKSQLASLILPTVIQSEPTDSSSYTLVSTKRVDLMRANIEKAKALKRQINAHLIKAAQAEAVNSQQAVQEYLQTYPLFEQLKQAVLLQEAAKSQQNQDLEAALAKLMETASGTSGGTLEMSLPDVTKHVHQLQNQGRLGRNVHQIANSIAQQFSVQTSGMRGKITMDRSTYRNSRQQSTISNELTHALVPLLEEAGWTVVPPVRGALPPEVSLSLTGIIRESGSGVVLQTTISNVDTGNTVGSSVLALDPQLDAELKPANYDALRKHEVAAQSIEVDTVASPPRAAQPAVITGQELDLEAWTDKPTYSEGDQMTVYCEVNQPAYVRLIYVLADEDGTGPKYTLLHDNAYIQQKHVGKPVVIGRFSIAPPFGSEKLIVLAQEEQFPQIPTVRTPAGYKYLAVQNPDEVAALIHKPPVRGALPMGPVKLDIYTQGRQ